MTRKYNIELVDNLKRRIVEDTFKRAPILIKQLPDSDVAGAMDPRLYEDMKKQLKLLKFLPSNMMKMDTSLKGIVKLRKMFNEVKSVSVSTENINIKKHGVQMADNEIIDVYQYTSAKTTAKMPTLFYIHGGGFFGGHHGVVEESLKLMCEKFAFNIFSVDYRLAPESPFPISHEDCFSALKWIVSNSEELHINKDLIFVSGDSAGGNLAQYCSTKDIEEKTNIVKGQLLLYPTLNAANVEDDYFKWDISYYAMSDRDKKGLTKMLMMFGGMSTGLKEILKVEDAHNDYLNPYTRDPHANPPTWLSVGEHDYLKVETLAYGAKLHEANIDVTMIIYNGMGHAYFDNTGVYPQCEDCIDEMGKFILAHSI